MVQWRCKTWRVAITLETVSDTHVCTDIGCSRTYSISYLIIEAIQLLTGLLMSYQPYTGNKT